MKQTLVKNENANKLDHIKALKSFPYYISYFSKSILDYILYFTWSFS